MTEVPTRMLERGRVTIPAHVRHDLELEHGDYVIVDVKRIGDDE